MSQARIVLYSGILIAALCGPTPGRAADPPSWRDFKDVQNTSFVEPGGDRAIQLSIDVAAPAPAVYAAFVTSEGFSSWAVPVAHVELRVGGIMESSYDTRAKLGDPNNIRNQIVAYVPDRLLVIRNLQAPPKFANPELFGRTVTIIELNALAADRTRVTITNAGYGSGEGWDTLYRHFEWGDAYTLAELKKRFERGPVDWSALARQQSTQAAVKTVEGSH